MTLATLPPSSPASRAAKTAREAERVIKRETRRARAIELLERLGLLREVYAEQFGQCEDAGRCEHARSLYAAAAVFEKNAAGSPAGIGWAVDALRLAVKMLGRTSQ